MFIYPVIKITLSVMSNYVARGTMFSANEEDAGPEELIKLEMRREKREYLVRDKGN